VVADFVPLHRLVHVDCGSDLNIVLNLWAIDDRTVGLIISIASAADLVWSEIETNVHSDRQRGEPAPERETRSRMPSAVSLNRWHLDNLLGDGTAGASVLQVDPLDGVIDAVIVVPA